MPPPQAEKSEHCVVGAQKNTVCTKYSFGIIIECLGLGGSCCYLSFLRKGKR